MADRERRPNLITLIALTKLLKAAMLFAAGFGAFHLAHGDVHDTIQHWIHAIRIDPENRYINAIISRATGLSDKKLEAVAVGTFLYGALFTVEGIGLMLDKRWAEYLTIVSTAGLLPIEIYELIQHVSLIKIVVLLVNAAIVVYLIVRLKQTRKPRHEKVIPHVAQA